MDYIVDPEGLLTIKGLEGVALFPIAETFISEREQGRAFLLHAGGVIEAPASSSKLKTAKKYKEGTKMKIKGREFVVSCSTLYVTKTGKWKLEACINPAEQKEGCHCETVVCFDIG